MSNLVDKYKIRSEGIIASVEIRKRPGKRTEYLLKKPSFSEPTLALLDVIKSELVGVVTITAQEVFDVNIIEETKEKLKELNPQNLEKYFQEGEDKWIVTKIQYG